MSLFSYLEQYRECTKIVVNDKFMGDEGACYLSKLFSPSLQSLQMKSNDVSGAGFVHILTAVPNSLRHLNIEYNSLGESEYEDWQQSLSEMVRRCTRLQRLNLSNNKITSAQLRGIVPALAASRSLRLLQLKYNSLTTTDREYLAREFSNNDTILYIEMEGNAIKNVSGDALDVLLKGNRGRNPIAKEKLCAAVESAVEKPLYRNNSIEQLSKENIVRQLEVMLEQNRKDSVEMKVRLEKELEELQRRERVEAKELLELDNKCNEMVIQNRNVKYELERTIAQHQQMERDQLQQEKVHEERLREANREINQLQVKYEDIKEKMQMEHQGKMREIVREWEGRLRNMEDKIRVGENQNSIIEGEIRKCMEKRERMKIEYSEEETNIRCRVEEEQTQRYAFQINGLQSKLKEVQEIREKFIRRNKDLVYELEKTEAVNSQQINVLEQQMMKLKEQEQQFIGRNKQFLQRNEKLKGQIGLKELAIEKLEEQSNRLNNEIELKKEYNREQVMKILEENSYRRGQQEEDKQMQLQKLGSLEDTLRKAQLDNARLRQEYAILAQKLQVGLGRAVQGVFAENQLY